MTLEFEIYDATTGDYQEDVSVDGYFDHVKNCYVPDPDDWQELLATFIGRNVVISSKKDIVIEGLDADGNLALLANDGAEDHPISLIDDFIESQSELNNFIDEDNNDNEEEN